MIPEETNTLSCEEFFKEYLVLLEPLEIKITYLPNVQLNLRAESSCERFEHLSWARKELSLYVKRLNELSKSVVNFQFFSAKYFKLCDIVI